MFIVREIIVYAIIPIKIPIINLADGVKVFKSVIDKIMMTPVRMAPINGLASVAWKSLRFNSINLNAVVTT